MHTPELIATPINLGSTELVSINELVSIVEEIAGVKLERTYKLDAPKGVAGRNSDNTFIQQVLGWEPNTPLRDGMAADLRLDRRPVRRPQGRQARRRGLTAMTGSAAPSSGLTPPRMLAAVGSLPYRLQLAGGWIDQPFVSSLNPEPPGSMVVVSLEPTVRYMDRCGMATGTRAVAQALWGDALPAGRTPDEPRPRALCGRERGPGRAVRVAGHVRPHLPGRQPARLRRDGRRGLVPGARRVHLATRRSSRGWSGSSTSCR